MEATDPPAPPVPNEPPVPQEPGTEELKKRIENLEADRLARKTAELLDIEKRIDAKMGEFKKFVADTEVQGHSMASTPEPTEEQKAIESARNLLKGSGLDPFK